MSPASLTLLVLAAAAAAGLGAVALLWPRALAIAVRDATSFFTSPIAYLTLLFYAFLVGYSFHLHLGLMELLDEPTMQHAFGGILGATLLVAPILTMRLFAEERHQGTLETLMTTPVSLVEVVLGKYLAALIFYGALLATTLFPYLVLTRILEAELDQGQVAAGYLGLAFFGATLVAIGVMVSAFARNQMSAAVVTLAIFFGLLYVRAGTEKIEKAVQRVVSVLSGDDPVRLDQASRAVRSVVGFLALNDHLEAFFRGQLALRDVAYYLSVIAFALVMTLLAVHLRRGK